MKVGFSPCPNDTYIFYAWANGKLGKPITPCIHDIQTLNELNYPLTKCSVATAFNKGARILPVGAALGFGVGPLVVGKKPLKKVAIPGKGTVAHLLFDLLLEGEFEKVFTTYDKILPMIEQGEVDGGVIIHESRFLYRSRGHQLLYDLGTLWEKKSTLPLPLGVLTLDQEIDPTDIINTLRNSINYSKNHFDEAYPYILSMSQEKERKVIRQHIDLYVNEESYQLSTRGRLALKTLFELAYKKGLLYEQAALCFCDAT